MESRMLSTNVRPPLLMVRGEGSWLFDAAGRRYLDAVQGWAVNALGHCPEELQAALTAQSKELLTPSPAYHNPRAWELCERLTGATGLHRAFLCSSGAEANECALKLARKWGRVHKRGAFEILTTHDAFHGRTLATMSASGKAGWDQLFPPNLPGFRKVPFGDLNAMSEALSERVAAVMVEPIQGEAGVIVPPEGYLRGLLELCRRSDTLLVFDEIQTGLGRTGELFRFQTEDARPDILTLGKGLGGGVPLAAVVTSERASCFEPGEHGGTYAGNPLMARCGSAVFDVVSRAPFLAEVRARGAALRSGLLALAERVPGIAGVRGPGLLQGIVLAEPRAERVAARALELGLLLNPARPNVIRLMPSLRLTDVELQTLLGLLEAALQG